VVTNGQLIGTADNMAVTPYRIIWPPYA